MDDGKDFYKIAIKARNFEIAHVWKRANVFWLFTAAIFVAYYSLKDSPDLRIIIAAAGFFLTACWTMVNRGSKFWQKNYEEWVGDIEKSMAWTQAEKQKVVAGLHQLPDSNQEPLKDIIKAIQQAGGLYSGPLEGIEIEDNFWSKRYSPSKLLVSCSDFLTITWLLLLIYSNVSLLFPCYKGCLRIMAPIGYSVVTVVWVLSLAFDIAKGKN